MSFIVLSPGRAGSVQLSSYLKNYCIFHFGNSEFIHLDKDTVFDENISNIIHSHHRELVESYLPSRKTIIITRNPVEIAASFMLAEQTGTYHFHSTSVEEYVNKYKDTKFVINPIYFATKVKEICNWYVNIKDLMETSIVLNYPQVINIEEACNILNIKFTLRFKLNMNAKPQPFNKWDKLEPLENLKNIGNAIFKKYQNEYPDIFTDQNFKY